MQARAADVTMTDGGGSESSGLVARRYHRAVQDASLTTKVHIPIGDGSGDTVSEQQGMVLLAGYAVHGMNRLIDSEQVLPASSALVAYAARTFAPSCTRESGPLMAISVGNCIRAHGAGKAKKLSTSFAKDTDWWVEGVASVTVKMDLFAGGTLVGCLAVCTEPPQVTVSAPQDRTLKRSHIQAEAAPYLPTGHRRPRQ